MDPTAEMVGRSAAEAILAAARAANESVLANIVVPLSGYGRFERVTMMSRYRGLVRGQLASEVTERGYGDVYWVPGCCRRSKQAQTVVACICQTTDDARSECKAIKCERGMC